mgnify:CR=1 FL=1
MGKLFNVAVQKEDNIYTQKVQIPQYLPSKECPKLESLVDFTKYTELIRDIQKSNVSPEQKSLLKYAATRHIVFNYAQIADYYAHSNKEMQELMEKSALVIIDIDDAIANGYVQLSNHIKDIIGS